MWELALEGLAVVVQVTRYLWLHPQKRRIHDLVTICGLGRPLPPEGIREEASQEVQWAREQGGTVDQRHPSGSRAVIPGLHSAA